MKVVHASFHRYDLPLRATWSTALARTTVRSGYLLRLDVDTGAHAWGDASPQPGERRIGLRGLASNLAKLATRVQREPVPLDVDPAVDFDVDGATRHAWLQAVLSLRAHAAGLSLGELLRRAYAGDVKPGKQVAVNATIPTAPLQETLKRVDAAIEQGYQCFKVKVAGRNHEIERLTAVRDRIGRRRSLRVDANAAWSITDAQRWLDAIAPLDVEYVEQPIAAGLMEDLRTLVRDSPVPVAADESAHNFAQAKALILRRIVPVIIVKPMALGGLDRAAELLALARKHDVKAVVTDSVESAIGRAGALHLARLLAMPAPACGLASGTWLSRDVVKNPPLPVKGKLKFPTAPGLGWEPIGAARTT